MTEDRWWRLTLSYIYVEVKANEYVFQLVHKPYIFTWSLSRNVCKHILVALVIAILEPWLLLEEFFLFYELIATFLEAMILMSYDCLVFDELEK